MVDKSYPPDEDRSIPENPSLEVGLKALKQKNYPQAIAHLEIIAQQPPLQQQLKAQMGLVIAYERTNQINKAISLCRNLNQISEGEIQTWASRNLKELVKRYPPKIHKKSTLYPPQNQQSTTPNQQPIETGFVAFNTPPEKSPKSKLKGNSNNTKTTSNSQNNLSKTQNQQPIETGFVAFNSPPEKSPKLKIKGNSNNTKTTSNSPNNLSIETGVTPLEKNAPVPEINRGKTSDLVQPSQPHQNQTPKQKLAKISPDISTTTTNTNQPKKASTNTASHTPNPPPKLTWRQAERAKGGRPLKSPNLTRFCLEQIVVVIALFSLSLTLLKFTLATTNNLLVWLPYCQPIQIFYRDQTRNFVIFIIVLFVFSPWLIDGLLRLFYGVKPLPTTSLLNYSKEANKVLRNFCQKNQIRGITLKLLPIDVPIAFSYGCRPRFVRIVVSQGLLDKLAEDEIATIYAREISHVQNGDFMLMSLAILMLQIPYTIYWQLTCFADASWDFVNHRLPEFLHFFVSGLRVLAAIISTFSYGLYWLLKLPILWLSRRRVYYSDRVACNLTGNPNGLTRAILKITISLAEDVKNQGKIRNLLESFDLLMPVGINQAITVGSIVSHSGFESIFNWEIVNPYRRWLEINNSHPLLGDRLQILGFYATFWKLETELNLGNININANATSKNQLINDKPENISAQQSLDWQKLFLQGAPFFGILIGLTFAGLLWLFGGISSAVGIWRLDWLFGDISILVGCLAIGFSIGILIRINHFFPDIKPTQILQNPDLLELLAAPEALPLDSQPIQLKGQLLGKSGMSNLLGQDLILQTTKGLVKLHYSSQLGPIGNLWPGLTRPGDFVGKSVTATGWWRRGATPWIDIDNLQADVETSQSGHPVWSTIVACATAIWGAYMIYAGRF